ncbi:MAG: hypothetical protein PHV11_06800 [Candidatus Bipolaricaulis sp.]|nr:hypothetical protein [Candidatus Bipolaricaulis sp.]
MAKELTQGRVEDFLKQTTGKFSLRDIWNELGIESEQGKSHLRVIMHRLEEAPDGVKVERVRGQDGVFRVVDDTLQEIDWQNADASANVPISLPFSLEKYVKIFPKSIIMVAGAPNAGKTAFLYNTIVLNMSNQIIDLYNSETSPEQMRERFEYFEPPIPAPAPWRTYERYDNFSDIVHPDHLSVIDYLDFNAEVYMVGDEIEKIFRKLNKGVAVIALQKRPSTKFAEIDLGYGGAFSLKKASLYVSMDSGSLKIIKGKSWRDPLVNPNGMLFSFQLVNGCKFVNIKREEIDTVT